MESEAASSSAHIRNARHTYRRLPTFALDEVPRDSAENCRAFCDKLYGQLLKNSLYFQSCIGICASKTPLYVYSCVPLQCACMQTAPSCDIVLLATPALYL